MSESDILSLLGSRLNSDKCPKRMSGQAGVPRSALFRVFASQNEAATARFCDLRTILIGDITFDITQVLPSAHYMGFRTQLRLPDRPKEVDAQRCGRKGLAWCKRRSKGHAHCRIDEIA
jgi:hypothetical protein